MLQAIGKYVILKAIYEKKQTIILTAKDPDPMYYEVISVGDEVKGLYPGDQLPYPQYTNQIVSDDGEKLSVISLENITAKIVR